MDRTTASYYRSILFMDAEDQRPVPDSLVRMHNFAFKRCQAMGIGSVIAKQAALSVAMLWLATTADGLAFAKEHTTIGDLFVGPSESEDDAKVDGGAVKAAPTAGQWDQVPFDSEVIVMVDEKPVVGLFRGRRGGWIDVQMGTEMGSEIKAFRGNTVRLATSNQGV